MPSISIRIFRFSFEPVSDDLKLGQSLKPLSFLLTVHIRCTGYKHQTSTSDAVVTFITDKAADNQYRYWLGFRFPEHFRRASFLDRHRWTDRRFTSRDSRYNGIDRGHSCSAESIEYVRRWLVVHSWWSRIGQGPFSTPLPSSTFVRCERTTFTFSYLVSARARRSFSSSSFLQLGLAFSFFLPFAPTNGRKCTPGMYFTLDLRELR